MTDNRTFSRKKAFLAAYAVLDSGPAITFCMVRDLTSEGARLVVSEAGRMPERFDLQINGRKRIYQAEVSWRTGTELGVRFVGRQPAESPRLARAS